MCLSVGKCKKRKAAGLLVGALIIAYSSRTEGKLPPLIISLASCIYVNVKQQFEAIMSEGEGGMVSEKQGKKRDSNDDNHNRPLERPLDPPSMGLRLAAHTHIHTTTTE